MQITNIEGIKSSVDFTTPLVVTFGTITTMETIVIKITTDGEYTGYGEACPFEPVTGENLDTEIVMLDRLKEKLVGTDPRNIEQVHTLMDELTTGHTALKAGIDIACYDLLGKSSGLPLYQLLGGTDNQIVTDTTLSIDTPEKMAAEARHFVDQGFTHLKVKAGVDINTDEQSLNAIQAEIGNEAQIKVDANQGWTAKQTIAFSEKMKGKNLSLIEQPLPFWDHSGNKLVRNNITHTLLLDETVHSPHDAINAVENGEADMINIKLMKSDGLWGAEGINRIAEAAGLQCMIGCMAETSIGICAAAHFAAAHQNVTYCDLDSFMYFKEPEWLVNSGFVQNGEKLTLTDAPGLGVEINL